VSNSKVPADDRRAWIEIPKGPLLKSAQKVTDRIDRLREDGHMKGSYRISDGRYCAGRHEMEITFDDDKDRESVPAVIYLEI
jgi:hypothetical protein